MVTAKRVTRGDFEGVRLRMVGAQVPEDLAEAFKAAAEARNLKQSDLLRGLIAAEVEQDHRSSQEPLVS